MYNWSTDENKLKANKEKHAIWKLEQMINFGLDGEKLDEQLLRKYWDKITIDPSRKKYLQILLNERDSK